MEPAAESNCDTLIHRALGIAPENNEVLLTLASIRMSQSRFDQAKQTVLKIYSKINNAEPCKLSLIRLSLPPIMAHDPFISKVHLGHMSFPLLYLSLPLPYGGQHNGNFYWPYEGF